MAKTEFKTIAQNKKAYHDYFVEETLEAGIELCGTEVKSLRQGRCNLKDAWNSFVRSSANTSRGSSTTQITERSRLSSRHTGQRSPSVKLQHTEQ